MGPLLLTRGGSGPLFLADGRYAPSSSPATDRPPSSLVMDLAPSSPAADLARAGFFFLLFFNQFMEAGKETVFINLYSP